MNGPVAQIVSITSYANAVLGGNLNCLYTLENSTALFCKKITFIDWVKKGGLTTIFKGKVEYTGKLLASDFINWITFLKKENTKQLFLHYVPSSGNPEFSDRMSAGFVGGGGRWLIEAWKGNFSDFWEAKWEVTNQNDKDNRIWSVTYARISRDDIVRKNEHSGIKNISKDLKEAITACYSFSERHQLDGWKIYFDNALKCLNTGDINLKTIYHKDIIPEKLFSEEVKRIIYAAQSSWVFGGMGSWNDMSFEGNEQKEYEKISDQLFSIVCKAISHATNGYGK